MISFYTSGVGGEKWRFVDNTQILRTSLPQRRNGIWRRVILCVYWRDGRMLLFWGLLQQLADCTASPIADSHNHCQPHSSTHLLINSLFAGTAETSHLGYRFVLAWLHHIFLNSLVEIWYCILIVFQISLFWGRGDITPCIHHWVFPFVNFANITIFGLYCIDANTMK